MIYPCKLLPIIYLYLYLYNTFTPQVEKLVSGLPDPVVFAVAIWYAEQQGPQCLEVFSARQVGQNGSVFVHFLHITRKHIEAATPSSNLKQCKNFLPSKIRHLIV